MLPSLRIACRLTRARFPTPRTPLLPRLSQPTATRSFLHPPKPSLFSRQFHSTPSNPSPTKYQRSQRLRWGAYIALLRWAARPTFLLEAAGLGALTGSFYVYNLEEVPISGRRRFNIISEDFLQSLSEDKHKEILEQYQGRILPENDPRSIQVRRVLGRLAPNSGLPSDYNWQATVIESDETNAFVIPGGSRGIFLIAAAWVVELFWGVPGDMSLHLLQFAIDMPKSRAQESEADHIGLLLMAKSCYDPKAAVAVWERMEIEEKKMPRPPEILSTHPSSRRRQAELTALLPKAYEIGLDSDCAVTGQYTDQFKKFGEELDFSFSQFLRDPNE
ncbi:uncharacterized protein DFL_004074 [Arthrobotrys flagrans]|uniref:Peptidase M48 domain-containing protein n=1 Tax=Arthrobotrys flagrans TaxID=97331 RepID=A0A437A3X7_ARTFL|nr:hypothetical protein DFL_004074 [Arthrobotrys flagrans]